jgi:hypothetical protein
MSNLNLSDQKKPEEQVKIEKLVTEMAIEYPAYGQLQGSNELKKQGTLDSPGGERVSLLQSSTFSQTNSRSDL